MTGGECYRLTYTHQQKTGDKDDKDDDEDDDDDDDDASDYDKAVNSNSDISAE